MLVESQLHGAKGHMSAFIISLDFELFWGVADSRTLAGYGRNVEGVWEAVPELLSLFRKYDIQATWATVGMLMCKNYRQWKAIRPALPPTYKARGLSNYLLGPMVSDNPRFFFARPLVEAILATPGQEIGTHTYSHFYCAENGVLPEQFASDLQCAKEIASDLKLTYSSIVFPRNQIAENFLPELVRAGIYVYRGNPEHQLYRNGHIPPGGAIGRSVRMIDSWLPLTGQHASSAVQGNSLVNIPASMFLRPWHRHLSALEPLRLARIKNAMSAAAIHGRNFHLWWHPHNFGVQLRQNMAALEHLLKHFLVLKNHYGMESLSMAHVARSVNKTLGSPHVLEESSVKLSGDIVPSHSFLSSRSEMRRDGVIVKM